MDGLATLILSILAILVIIIFVGSIYAFFYAIIHFIFSSGDPEKIKKARNSIRYMILGIVMTLGILFIFPVLLKKINVPGYQYYTATNIFAQVSRITGGLISFTKEAANEYQAGAQQTNPVIINNNAINNNNDAPIPSEDEDYDYNDLEL